ncbi:hypothetical protein GS580_16605 [Rhodococcus hoagii]|nr:hypothetical protein [Prescottella equi]
MSEDITTQYGFRWGSAEVARVMKHQGTHVGEVGPAGRPQDGVEVYVSPTGRSIRVFKNGLELKPVKEGGDQP